FGVRVEAQTVAAAVGGGGRRGLGGGGRRRRGRRRGGGPAGLGRGSRGDRRHGRDVRVLPRRRRRFGRPARQRDASRQRDRPVVAVAGGEQAGDHRDRRQDRKLDSHGA